MKKSDENFIYGGGLIPQIKWRDVLQVIVGAGILAIPVGFTEETWILGESLPMMNVFGLFILSILFIFTFTYYHYHHNLRKEHNAALVKRVIITYLFAFIIVSAILILIQRAPWMTDWAVALKRTIVVTFPCSLSAAIADTIH